MRKCLILFLGLFVVCINTNIVFASKNSEIRSYRAVKQAKSKVINKKIKAQKKELTKLLSNPTLTDEEYAIKTEEMRKNMANLYAQREQNKKDYMKTKKTLKRGKKNSV